MELDSEHSCWPIDPSISLVNLKVRYQKDLSPALKNVTLSISGGEKVGVVGRYVLGYAVQYGVPLLHHSPPRTNLTSFVLNRYTTVELVRARAHLSRPSSACWKQRRVESK